MKFGVYTIQVAQWAFESEPTEVVATGELNDNGCDTKVQVELHYANGGKATIATSSLETLHNKVTIKGTKGQIMESDSLYSKLYLRF